VIISHTANYRKSSDGHSYITRLATTTLPDFEIRETANVKGWFQTQNLTIREQVLTPATRMNNGRFGGGGMKTRTIGSTREKYAGILIRLYHEDKVVGEYSVFDPELKRSDFSTDFEKPSFLPVRASSH